jgi:hypothetical protein
MAETTGRAADVPGAPERPIHDHAMVGLDVPLQPSLPSQSQAAAVQSRLDPALDAQLCVTRAGSADVTLINAQIGHAWPSGAAHDRRAWVELVAYTGADVVYRDGAAPPGSGAPAEPPAFLLDDSLFARGDVDQVLFMWEATSLRRAVLPPTTTLDPSAPGFDHGVTAHYAIPPGADRVTMRVLVTPVAVPVLSALVASGDLDPATAATVPTYALAGTELEWTSDRGYACLP